MTRPEWHEYFMSMAITASKRGTCDRKQVGAVIVKNNCIISTGYNGSIVGLPHCDEIGHEMVNNHCVRTVHAEANALLQAARHGHSVKNSIIYTSASPCWDCFKLLANAGIKTIVYHEFYREDKIFSIAKQLGIEMVKI